MKTNYETNLDIKAYFEKPYKLTAGNSKISKNVFTFSTLMGDYAFVIKDKKGTTLRIVGTCGKHCKGCKGSCYVKKSYRYSSVVLAHAKQTFGFRNDPIKWFNDINGQLARAKTKDFVRLHQSGEIESPELLKAFISFARNNEKYTFYVYSKAYDLIKQFAAEIDNLPKHNLIVLISIWGEYGINEYHELEHFDWIKAFVYINKEYTIEFYAKRGIIITTFCRAYDVNGNMDKSQSCGNGCKKCMTIFKSFKVIGCFEH